MMAWWQWLLGLWSALGAAQAPAPEIGPSTLSSACGTCHPAELDQWRQSRHAKAFTNGLFRAEWEPRRTAWCASCHAPGSADPRTVRDDDPVALQGVGCVSCHLSERGQMLAGRKGADSPHDTQVSQEFGSADFCASCHEFAFPEMGDDGMPVGALALPMQETVTQFRASPAAARGGDCRDCHMKASTGSHRFPGSHDVETLRSALQIELCRAGDQLRIEIANVGAAHAVPTGGVNRHLVLRSWRSTHPERMVEFYLGRRFEGDVEQGKRLVSDTTLAVAENRAYDVLTSDLGGTAAAPINVELRYVYPLEEFAPLPPGTARSATAFRSRGPISGLQPCEPGE